MTYINAVNNEFKNDLLVKESSAGTSASVLVENEDNSNASSHALAKVTTGGGSAGDSFVHLTNNVVSASIGIDNSDSDALVFSLSSTPGTSNVARCTTDGEWTYPLQSSFSGRITSSVNNVTGNGTVYTLLVNNEQFDKNADFNTGTYTFTCPKAGVYLFIGKVAVVNCTSMTNMDIIITTTSIAYYSYFGRGATSGESRQSCSIITWMDAADTAYLRVATSGEAGNTNGVYQLADSQLRTFFCGALLQ